MIKCPYCGRKAEHYPTDFSTFISEDEVEVVREYTCVECDETFYTQDCYNKAGYTLVAKEREDL